MSFSEVMDAIEQALKVRADHRSAVKRMEAWNVPSAEMQAADEAVEAAARDWMEGR